MKTLATQIFNEEHGIYLSADGAGYSLSKEFAQKLRSRTDKKARKTYRFRGLAACAALLITCAVVFVLTLSNNSYNVAAAEIDYNLEKLSELEADIITSSNPYAYKDTENYNNIVELGPIAIEILEQKYEAGELEGFNAYIAGAAIEDIAGISLWSVTGTDWSTSEEFFAGWRKMLSELPETFKSITEGDESTDAKVQKIKEYGILGEYYLTYISKSDGGSINFYGCEISAGLLKAARADLDITSEEYSEIENYLEKKYKN